MEPIYYFRGHEWFYKRSRAVAATLGQFFAVEIILACNNKNRDLLLLPIFMFMDRKSPNGTVGGRTSTKETAEEAHRRRHACSVGTPIQHIHLVVFSRPTARGYLTTAQIACIFGMHIAGYTGGCLPPELAHTRPTRLSLWEHFGSELRYIVIVVQ